MSAWLTLHGWKLGLVLILVGVVFTPTNPVAYAVLSIATILCCWWGLAVRVRRSFLEGYREGRPRR
jgi:hypothetical protein